MHRAGSGAKEASPFASGAGKGDTLKTRRRGAFFHAIQKKLRRELGRVRGGERHLQALAGAGFPAPHVAI